MGSLLLVGRLGVGSVVAGAGGGKLEGLNGEGEVLVIGVVDEEPVVDRLLDALGQVALWDEGARGPLGPGTAPPGPSGSAVRSGP